MEYEKLKIKCLRFEFEICNKLASIQVFHNKTGAIKYARARHYVEQSNGKPSFEYHQQTLQYINRKISELPKTEIGHNRQRINDDLNKPKLSLEQENRSWGWELNPYITALQAVA